MCPLIPSNLSNRFKILSMHTPSPTFRRIIHWHPRNVFWYNAPMGIVATTLVACPRSASKFSRCWLITIHWMRDSLDLVAAVALIPSRILSSQFANRANTSFSAIEARSRFFLATHATTPFLFRDDDGLVGCYLNEGLTNGAHTNAGRPLLANYLNATNTEFHRRTLVTTAWHGCLRCAIFTKRFEAYCAGRHCICWLVVLT
mmetsp:Transcript_24001/g.31876  ORF Transcript_24001/g.31876 Transcript_24001/m.31876 type:complete len:202 (-) Transcript_24001:87-692(-)